MESELMKELEKKRLLEAEKRRKMEVSKSNDYINPSQKKLWIYTQPLRQLIAIRTRIEKLIPTAEKDDRIYSRKWD